MTDPAIAPPPLPSLDGAPRHDRPPRPRRGCQPGRRSRLGYAEDDALGPVFADGREVLREVVVLDDEREAVRGVAASGGRAPQRQAAVSRRAQVTRLRVTPIGLERELTVGGGAVTERAFVPLDGEFVALEWHGVRADALVELRPAGSLHGDVIRAADDAAFQVLVYPPSAVAYAAGVIRVRVPAQQHVLAIVAKAGPGAADIARRLHSLVRARGAAATMAAHRGLQVSASAHRDDPLLSAALSWARLALAGANDAAPVSVLLARLVLGDAAPARAALMRPGRFLPPEIVHLATAYLAWTGETGAVRSVWPAIREVLAGDGIGGGASRPGGAGKAIGGGVSAPGAAHTAANADDLVALAEAMGDPVLAGRVRAQRRVALGGARAAERLALPRAHEVPFASEGDAASFVLSLARELVGADPDALHVRLRLAPRIPAAWHELEMRRLRMGDAAVSLRYRRDARTQVFDIVQDEGGTPVRLILEPLLEDASATDEWRFEVDGVEAALDRKRAERGVAFAVQLVLDHARQVKATCLPTRGRAGWRA